MSYFNRLTTKPNNSIILREAVYFLNFKLSLGVALTGIACL